MQQALPLQAPGPQASCALHRRQCRPLGQLLCASSRRVGSHFPSTPQADHTSQWIVAQSARTSGAPYGCAGPLALATLHSTPLPHARKVATSGSVKVFDWRGHLQQPLSRTTSRRTPRGVDYRTSSPTVGGSTPATSAMRCKQITSEPRPAVWAHAMWGEARQCGVRCSAADAAEGPGFRVVASAAASPAEALGSAAAGYQTRPTARRVEPQTETGGTGGGGRRGVKPPPAGDGGREDAGPWEEFFERVNLPRRY
jgi:hypothetical protein